MLGKVLIVVLALISASFAGRIMSKLDYCVHEGRRYEHGQQIAIESCSYFCSCDASTAAGAFFKCEKLCPPNFDYICSKGLVATVIEEPAGPEELNCVCSYHTCVYDLKEAAGYFSYGGDSEDLIELEPIPIDFER